MRKRLNDGILSDHQLAVGEIVRHRHFGDLREAVESQHAGRIVQRQIVGVRQCPAPRERQRPCANSEFRACVAQRLPGKHVHR